MLLTALFCCATLFITSGQATVHESVERDTAAASSCHIKGFQWAYYNYTAGDGVGSYKTKTPVYNSHASAIGFGFSNNPTPRVASIYGSPAELSTIDFVVIHRGYIHAHETGTYTYNLTNVDDVAFLWVGSNAYSGWTQANANDTLEFHGTTNFAILEQSLTKGEFMPFRILFAQAEGAASLIVTITSPKGTVLAGAATTPNKQITRYGCGKTNLKLAPKFAPFGSET